MIDALLSGQLLFAAAVLGALYALIGLGLNLVYGTMRLLNIAHGDVMMLGAYAAFWWFTLTALSPLIALPLIGLAGAALGLAFSGTPRAYRHLDTVYHLGNTAMTGNRIASLAVALVLLGGVLLFLNRTVFGMEIKALTQHREAARIVGINVGRVQAVAIALAALAGALLSMTEQVTPFMGFRFTIAAFVVIIMGELGNIRGGMIAGFLLALIEIYAVTVFSAEVRSILIYGVFVAVLLARPQGLLGRAQA